MTLRTLCGIACLAAAAPLAAPAEGSGSPAHAVAKPAAAQAAAPSAGGAPAVVPRSLELPKGKLFVTDPVPDVELFATGDVIGYIDTCGCKLQPAGGISRRSWLVGEAHGAFPGVPFALLDTGNFTDVPTAAGDVRTRTLLESMVKLGYGAVGIGERDLDLGYDDFKKKIEGIDMPFVSTNIVTQGTTEPVFPPYAIVEADGRHGKVRIGVLSVVRYNPLWQKAGPAGTNLAIASPQAMIERYVPDLRGKADVIVLLAGIPKVDAPDLARSLTGVDLMLDAYGGEFSTVQEKAGSTPLVYLGNQGKRVAENRILLDGSKHPADIVTYMHFLTSAYPDDPATKTLVDGINAKNSPTPADAPKKAVISIPGTEKN